MRKVRIMTAAAVALTIGAAALALAQGERRRPFTPANQPPADLASANQTPANLGPANRTPPVSAPSQFAGAKSIRTASPGVVAGVPNYYDQLFGDATGAATIDASDPSKGIVRLAAGTEEDMGPTVQADYEQAAGTSTQNQIQQIAIQSDADVVPVRQREEPAAVAAPSDPNPFAAVPTIPASHELTDDDGPAHRLMQAQVDPPATVEATWERIGEITVGRPCRCELLVKNAGAGTAESVAVEASFPPSLRLTSAEPVPENGNDRLIWKIGTLTPGAEKRIAVTFVPSQGGDLPLSALVHSTDSAATTLQIREPMLNLAIEGAKAIPIGESTAQTIVVSNPGTGTTDEVLVEISLPAGLEHGKGRTITMPLGSLGAKQSHSIPLTLFATQGGPQVIRVRAVAGPMLRQETTTTVVVSAPTLKVAADGPGLRFVGRNADYVVSIMNEGAAAASGVRVSHTVPEGFEFVSAASGGRFEPATREIVWYVGRIEARQSESLVATLTATATGAHRHLVAVTSEGGTRVETAVETAVESTASLAVEVIDLDDPVELGVETGYEVRIRNEGTRPATNVVVDCQVPAGVASLAARGPTNHRGEGNLLTFEPIAELKPGTTALFRVAVRGTAPGKHRFRVRLTSDSIDEPLVHEELTHFYAD